MNIYPFTRLPPFPYPSFDFTPSIKQFGENHLRSGNHRKNKLNRKQLDKQCL